MKFEAERQDLAAALAKCTEAAEKTSPHTPFRACCIETDSKEHVRFFAGSEAMSVDTVIPADVQEQGKCIVSPWSLEGIVGAIYKGRILLKADKKLSIKSKDTKRNYTLSFIECEMPRIEEPPASPWQMSATELMEAWNTVKVAVADEASKETRTPPAVELIVTQNGFSLSGSNGRAVVRRNYAGKFKTNGTVIAPRRAFQVLKLLATEDEKVKVSADQRSIYWENQDTLCACRLIGETNKDGTRTYPDIDFLVDRIKGQLDDAPKVNVEADKIIEALHAVNPVVDRNIPVVSLRLKGTSLSFEVESDTGTADEELVVDPGTKDFLVHVSPKTFQDALLPLRGKTVTLADVAADYCLVISTENVFALLSTINKK